MAWKGVSKSIYIKIDVSRKETVDYRLSKALFSIKFGQIQPTFHQVHINSMIFHSCYMLLPYNSSHISRSHSHISLIHSYLSLFHSPLFLYHFTCYYRTICLTYLFTILTYLSSILTYLFSILFCPTHVGPVQLLIYIFFSLTYDFIVVVATFSPKTFSTFFPIPPLWYTF